MYRLARSHFQLGCCITLASLLLGLSFLTSEASAQRRLWFPSVQAQGNRHTIDAHRSHLQKAWQRPPQTAASPSAAAEVRAEGSDEPANVSQVGYQTEPFIEEVDALPLSTALTMDSSASCAGETCAGCLKQQHLILGRVWARAEWLSWWSSSMGAPPLVTTSPTTVPPTDAGILGEPTTTILFGGDLADNDRGGMRYSLGYLLKPCHNLSVIATYAHLGDAGSSFTATDEAFPVIVRPFFDVENDQQNGQQIAFPGSTSGAISITATSAFDTFDLAFSQVTCSNPLFSKEFSIGYRHARLRDRLRIESTSTALSGGAAGTTLTGFDQFDADSTFYGGQLGFNFRSCHRTWSFELLLKVALGGTNTDVRVDGLTEISGTSVDTREGNLLAQSSNIGNIDTLQFAILSELGLRLNYQISPCWTVTTAYTFMHLSEVARASEQIDTRVNLSQIPPSTLTGSLAPILNLNTNDYWVQGVSLGIERRF